MPNGSKLPVPYQQPPPYYPPYQPPIIYTTGGGKSGGNTALTLGIVAITLVGGGLAIWYVLKGKGSDAARTLDSFDLSFDIVDSTIAQGTPMQVTITITNKTNKDLTPSFKMDIKGVGNLFWNKGSMESITIAANSTETLTLERQAPSWTGAVYAQIVLQGTTAPCWNNDGGVAFTITPGSGPGSGFAIDRDASGWENTTVDVGQPFAFIVHWQTGATPIQVKWNAAFRETSIGVHRYEDHQIDKNELLPANTSSTTRLLTPLSNAAGATYDGRVVVNPADNTGQTAIFEDSDCLHVQEGGELPSGYTIDAMTPVGGTVLHAGGKATVKVDITNNGTSPITNKSFRLDLLIKGTLITGTPKTVTIPVGSSFFQVLSGALPTTLNDASYTIRAKLQDITVSSNIIVLIDDTTTFTAIGDSYLANIGGESLVDSMIPTDRLVSRAGGTPLTFNMRYKHRGSSKNYKCGVWIKDNGVDGGYWLQKTFTTTESPVWENGLVALTGTFRATPQLHTGQDIECLFVFMEATVTPAKPPQTQQFLFANWDTILRVKA